MKTWIGVALCAIACMGQAAGQAKPPSVEDLLRREQNTLVKISPGGEYLAVGTRVEDGSIVAAILDRGTRALVQGLAPEKNGAIEDVEWVSPRRLFAISSERGKSVQESFLNPWIVAMDVDGKNRDAFFANVFDTLLDDDAHVLTVRCGRSTNRGCSNHVQMITTEGRDVGKRLAEAPLPDAGFMADNAGTVRFATGWNDDDEQQLWLHDGKTWTLLNDETSSGVEVVPLGVSRDGTQGFLRSERKTGGDAIERIDFATGKREVVLADDRQDPVRIVWSADGAEPIGATYGLQVPRARFWNPEHPDARLTRTLERAFPDDAVALTSGSRDGRHAVVTVWGDRDPGSYYLFDRTTRKTELILRRRPWLDPPSLAPMRAVSLQARDGTPLHGYLTMPLAAGATRPPLVVMPHGGPFGMADRWGFDEEVQLLAAYGYAVLQVNFRGSGGFGRSFVEAGFRQWGRRMQDDLTDATRWAQQQAGVDAARTCIWGSSYGGYAALMGAIREPALYRCVVATSAVTDLGLMWRWGDIRRTRSGKKYLARAIGEDPVERAANSPARHVAPLQAPLLLVHGRRDARVSYEHARALKQAMDAAGKPYEEFTPRDETHGMYGDANRDAYYRRVLAFLGKHLAP